MICHNMCMRESEVTEKTPVLEIAVGDTIDFDAHKGCTAFDQHSLNGPYETWVKVTGQHVVARMERVSARPGTMAKKTASAISITLDNGMLVVARGMSKFPVVKS